MRGFWAGGGVFGQARLGVLVVLLGSSHLWGLPQAAPKTHSALVMSDASVSTAERISVKYSEIENKNWLSRVDNWYSVVHIVVHQVQTGVIRRSTRSQECKRRLFPCDVVWRDREVVNPINESYVGGIGEYFSRGITEIRRLERKTSGRENAENTYPRSFRKNGGFCVQQGGIGVILGGFGKLFQMPVVLSHPLFVSTKYKPLHDTYDYQSQSEQCEKSITHVLYSLVPLGIFIVVGINLGLGGRFARIGSLLVYGGLIYLGLSVLFVVSMRFW